jgi:hypothetical protein
MEMNEQIEQTFNRIAEEWQSLTPAERDGLDTKIENYHLNIRRWLRFDRTPAGTLLAEAQAMARAEGCSEDEIPW